ncbi:MAG: tetratricopeptide repeat protein [Acidobacteriota bacterium]|nr:tetratricopeptide repeat protein [Acidobacteriota bacterium]
MAIMALFISAIPPLVAASDDYAALFQQAAALSQQGKYELAAEKYEAALRLRPGSAEALNNVAVMYYEAHRYQDAFAAASQIWRSHPELKSAALIAGLAAVQSNRPGEALAPLEKLVAAEPSNRDALLGLASAHLQMKDVARAAELYVREIENDPRDVNAWYGKAICYERMAEDASRKLSRMPGGTSYSKRLLAEYLQGTGDGKLAAEAFGESLATESTSSAKANREYETARDLAAKSRDSFEQLVSLAPDSWQASLFLGDVERQHGSFSAALEHYQKTAELQPENAAPLLGMGTVYWEMGNFDRAVTCLREALKFKPDSMQAIFELANIAVRRHQDAAAIPLLRQYLATQPDAAAARIDLGRAYFHLGQFEKAVEAFTSALDSDEKGDVHYQLATALRKLGRMSEAETAMRESNVLRKAELKREQELHSRN